MRLLRLIITLAVLGLVLATSASAKTIKPNKTSDHAPDGCTKQDCTLREAIDKANSTPEKDWIKLKGGKTYKLAQAGKGEDANVTGDLDITAPLKISAKGKRATVNGNDVDRVFNVPISGSDAKFVNLVITGGDPSMGPSGNGGGIDAEGPGTVKLVKSVVSKNSAFSGGGIYTGATAGSFKVSKSTIAHNDATSGGGIDSEVDTTVIASTIEHNESSGTGGGIKTHQGLTLRNSTIYGNESGQDGGGVSALANTTLNNVTITKNKANNTGGGISSSGTTTVSNTLIARNKLAGGGVGGIDCAGAFMSGGHNLRGTDEVPDCTGFTGNGDIVKKNAKLGDLAKNGGPTKTVELKQGSPAIGKAGNDSEKKDQRGHKRDNHPDIGAFER
jgi:CSLREA domain-containing protein